MATIVAHSFHVTAVLGYCLYVVAGNNAMSLPLASVERYVPTENKWETVQPMAIDRDVDGIQDNILVPWLVGWVVVRCEWY